MKIFALICLIMLFSGCICCGGDDESYDDLDDEYCESPYIHVGSECCLDQNEDMICDKDQVSETTTSLATTSSTQKIAETTVKPTTSTQSVTVTSTTVAQSYSPAYECVKKLKSREVTDGIFYLYSTRCGDKFISTASTIEGRTGVEITKIKINGNNWDANIKVLECFYGQHYDGHPEFGKCPRLLCPKSGEVKTLSGRNAASVSSQMSGFAKNC